MGKFLRTSSVFVLGLILSIAGADYMLGWQTARNHGRGTIGPEVYRSIETASMRDDRVRCVYLGDSVAHQLLPPSEEPRAEMRFLACNQAISMAGQCYLMEKACENFRNLSDVYVFYNPRSLRNDLATPLARSYFCGYFHTPSQVREIFSLKHDVGLSAQHLGRLMAPNLMAVNDREHAEAGASGGVAAPGVFAVVPANSEPILQLLLPRRENRPADPPDDTVYLSHTSAYFLDRMRALARTRNVALHLLPCPCRDDDRLRDEQSIYDAPIIFLDASWFRDDVHLKKPYISTARDMMKAAYHLPDQGVPQYQSLPRSVRPTPPPRTPKKGVRGGAVIEWGDRR